MKRALTWFFVFAVSGCAAQLGGGDEVGSSQLALQQVPYNQVSNAPPCSNSLQASDLHAGMLLRETVPYGLIAVFESNAAVCVDSWETIEALLANRWRVGDGGLVEPTPEPDVKLASADAFEPTPEPDVEPTPEPDVEPTPEPDVDPMPGNG